MKNFESLGGGQESTNNREEKMKKFAREHKEKMTKESLEVIARKGKEEDALKKIKSVQDYRENKFGPAEMNNRERAGELVKERGVSEVAEVVDNGFVDNQETSLNKTSKRVKNFFSKEPLKKVMDRIKAIANPKEKKQEIEESAKQHALMTKLEEWNHEHLERNPLKITRYTDLSTEDKQAVDKVYNTIKEKWAKYKYEKPSDYDRLMTDLDVFRNFDIKNFKTCAEDFYKVDVKIKHKV